MYSNGAVN